MAISSNCSIKGESQETQTKGLNDMKVSARNLLPGTVKAVHLGAVNAEVIIDAGGIEIVSIITKESAENLGLKAGSKVKAMVKASSVMVITD